jgi:flagellar motor switch protein FliN/FliY
MVRIDSIASNGQKRQMKDHDGWSVPMETIDTFDIEKAILDSMTEVFDTMLSMGVEYAERVGQSYLYGERILSSVNLVGEVMGIVNIQMSQDCSREITSAMLGIKEHEIEGIDDVKDVIGEVCNMVGGKLKSSLCDVGLDCRLSTPVLTTGKDYKCNSRDMTRKEHMTFYQEEHTILVEVAMKSAAPDRSGKSFFPEAEATSPKTDFEAFSVADAIDQSVPEVFETMLDMEAVACDPESVETSKHVNQIVGSISMSGTIQGRLNIYATEDFSRKMAASMLDMEPDEIESLEEVKDVIGEICNMISGTLKSDLCDAGHDCVLSPPSFTTGSNFEMKFLQLSRRETFAYCCGDNVVKILVGLEPGES